MRISAFVETARDCANGVRHLRAISVSVRGRNNGSVKAESELPHSFDRRRGVAQFHRLQ